MSSGTLSPPQGRPGSPIDPDPREAFIDDRLRRTRRQVKGVDVATGLLILLIGTLAYLLAAALIDHWLIAGGLGFWGRLMLLLGLLGGAGWQIARGVLPPLVHRINPIFAAHTIEQSQPSLKNSLVNFLLLRGHRGEVSQPVYQTLEHRAAADLSQIEIESAVDRIRVIRLGYLLVGTVAVCCLYLVLSPKSPLSSAVRVLWPWSTVAAPTRVTIDDVRPGDAVAFHGDFVTVSAEVRGLRPDEPVALYYSTADGQSVDQKIPMTPPEDGFAHQVQCRLPAEELGLQQDVTYYLSAGDSTTRRFTVGVQTAPTILVDRVEYDYPDYTALANQTVNREGDLRAIEGTQVMIHAAANRNVASAKIDLGCTGLRELDMKPSGERASGRFVLRLRPDDPTLPEFDCYQLRFRDDAGLANPQPPRHRIEVIRDLPPEIELVSPTEDEVEVAENGRLAIRLRARDPDFALRRVAVRAECDGRSLVIAPLLDAPHQNEFQAEYLFEPARARFDGDGSDAAARRLEAGDRVRYWAEAEDNKQPTAGCSTTAQQWITIVAVPGSQPGSAADNAAGEGEPRPAPGSADGQQDGQSDRENQPSEGGTPNPTEQPDPSDQPPEDGGTQDQGPQDQTQQEPGKESGEGEQAGPQAAGQEGTEVSESGDQAGNQSEPSDGTGNPSESGTAAQDGQRQGDGSAGASRQPIDPDTQPGDAIEEILKHQQDQQRQQGGQGSANPKAGDRQNDGGQSGDPQSASGQPDGQRGGQRDGQRPGAENQTPPKPGDGEGTGRPEAGDQPTGQEPTEQPTEQPAGSQPDGTSQSPGDGQPLGGETRPPAPQGANRPQDQPPSQAGDDPGETPQQEAESPSTSPDQSDAQGETSGDRSGNGERGGGQRSSRSGAGAAGSQTEARDGGSAGQQQGEGPTGSDAGEQVETDRQTGNSAARRGGSRSGDSGQPGEGGAGDDPSGQDDPAGEPTSQDNSSDGSQPGGRTSSGSGAQNQGIPGGRGGEQPSSTSPSEPVNSGGDAANLDYARRATDLALEHLQEQMDQEDSDLLDRLGWTREEARKFAEKWTQMKQAAARDGAEGMAAQQQLDRAVESLGLAPRGTQLQGGQTGQDRLPGLREAGRLDPPSDWSDLFRAYTRGVASGGDQ